MKSLLLIVILSCMPLRSLAVMPDVDRYADLDSVKRELSGRPLHVIEGIWRFPDTGATALIERVTDTPRFDGADSYRMVVLRSPSRSLLPGTVMGELSATSSKGVYTASIYTDSDGGSRLLKAKSFTLALDGDGRLGFKRRGMKVNFQLWRMIPYISRLGVRTSRDNPDSDGGCVRVFPMPVDGPVEPIYL